MSIMAELASTPESPIQSTLTSPSTSTTVHDTAIPVHLLSSMDQIKTTELLRPVSKSSRITDASNTDTVETGPDGTTGVILIGIETNDATTVDRTTIDSRRTSSTIDPQRLSDANEADPIDPGNHHVNNQNKPDAPPNPPIRRSNSSSTAASPVVLTGKHRSSTISSESSTSQHQHTSSQESNRPRLKRTGRPRKTSSVDPPVTSPTTITSDSPSRPHSAAEFQKFRDQLHSGPPNSAFHPENEEWVLHPNPHHPKTKTEVLRIERAYTPIALPTKTGVSNITNFDVLIPRFSPSYPPILREYGIGEMEWTSFVHRVNRYCMEAFDPFRWSNLVVNIVAVLTCWLSEWIMPNITKRKLMKLEKYIDEINRGPWREKGVQIISLRRTAYLNIDIELQTSLLNDPTTSRPSGFGQGTWDRETPVSNPTTSSLRGVTQSEARANSRTSLV